MKTELIRFYLDWVNNFVSIARLAEHYNISEQDAETLITIGKKYHEANYSPSLKTLASANRLDASHFLAFANTEPITDNFKIKNGDVPPMYIEGLLKAYKEHGYYNMLAYVKALGLTPIKCRITTSGYEVDVDPGDNPSVEHFTSVNGKTVRLSYVDIANEGIVKDFKF